MEDDIAKRFVCACLEMQWNTSAEECARQSAKENNIDWRSVRQLVYSEELAPFLYYLTRNRGIVPADLEQDLSNAYYATAAQNTLRLRDLEQVLGLLAAQGIPAIVLKGAALVETLYSNAAVRPMEDIDLMVRPESLPAAIQVLSEFCGAPPSSESQSHGFIQQEREITFQKAGETNTLFDLHWQALDSPFYPHTLFTNWLWESSVSFQFGNAPAMILSHEATLLHLCGHYLIDEGRKELLWLADIAATIAKYRDVINWKLLSAKAQAFGLVLPLRRVISKISDEWENLIPREIVETVSGLGVAQSEMVFYAWANSKDRATVRLVNVNLMSMLSWHERLGYIGSHIFPPISYMQHRYGIRNPFFVLLTYPYRWLLSLYRAVIH